MHPFDFDLLFSAFETSQRARGNTDVTISWYKTQIQIFRDWLATSGHVWPEWCGVEIIEAFLADQSRRYKPRTVDARRRALSAFLSFCDERELLDGLPNPMRRIRRVRIPKTAPRRASLSEYEMLLRSIRFDRWLDYRDKAIIILLFSCGLRIAEVAGLHISDIITNDRMVFVRGERGAKRGKDRLVPFADDLALAIAGYMMNRPAYNGPELWLSDNGRGGVRGALKSSGIAQMLKRRCEKAGIRHLNPHSFRHAFATEFLNAGADMSAVSKMLGHDDIKTTKDIYAEWLDDGLSREYQDAWRAIHEKRRIK